MKRTIRTFGIGAAVAIVAAVFRPEWWTNEGYNEDYLDTAKILHIWTAKYGCEIWVGRRNTE